MNNPAQPSAQAPALGKRAARLALSLLPFVLLAIVWQLIASTQPAYVFPPLGKVFGTLGSLWRDGSVLPATLSTLRSVAIGAALSLVVGTLVGFVLARYESFTGPLLNFTQTVPYVVWALMSMIWFGLSIKAVVFTIFIASFPVISFNVAAGLNNVDQHLYGMAQSVRANRFMVLRHIVLPSLTPYLLSASRTMLGTCWKISILAELFAGGASGGVGYSLSTGWEFNRTQEIFAWTVWLVVLMMLSEWLIIKPLEYWATRWQRAG